MTTNRQATATCDWCGDTFDVPHDMGPTPRYCKQSHRQRAYEARRGTGAALIEHWTGRLANDSHRRLGECPRCGEDVTVVGIPDLVYSYERCDCGEPDYPHLVEQLWHAACFGEWRPGESRLRFALWQIAYAKHGAGRGAMAWARGVAKDALTDRAPQ